jgi:hypothetical protein
MQAAEDTQPDLSLCAITANAGGKEEQQKGKLSPNRKPGVHKYWNLFYLTRIRRYYFAPQNSNLIPCASGNW